MFWFRDLYFQGVWVSRASCHGRSILQAISRILLEVLGLTRFCWSCPPWQCCQHVGYDGSFNGRVCTTGKQHVCDALVFLWPLADANKCVAMVVFPSLSMRALESLKTCFLFKSRIVPCMRFSRIFQGFVSALLIRLFSFNVLTVLEQCF